MRTADRPADPPMTTGSRHAGTGRTRARAAAIVWICAALASVLAAGRAHGADARPNAVSSHDGVLDPEEVIWCVTNANRDELTSAAQALGKPQPTGDGSFKIKAGESKSVSALEWAESTNADDRSAFRDVCRAAVDAHAAAPLSDETGKTLIRDETGKQLIAEIKNAARDEDEVLSVSTDAWTGLGGALFGVLASLGFGTLLHYSSLRRARAVQISATANRFQETVNRLINLPSGIEPSRRGELKGEAKAAARDLATLLRGWQHDLTDVTVSKLDEIRVKLDSDEELGEAPDTARNNADAIAKDLGHLLTAPKRRGGE